MAVRFGRRIPNWAILVAGSLVVSVALALAALNRPVPEYLVAATTLKPGAPIQAGDLRAVALDLGELSPNYLLADELLPGSGVMRVVREGDLISRADVTFSLDESLTSIRFTPKLKPADQVAPGTFVSVWQVLETDEGEQVQQLVASAEVLDLVYGEGLFAAEYPEVELRVSWEQSALLLRAVSSESDIYVLPLT